MQRPASVGGAMAGAWLVAVLLLVGAGCVETAECNESAQCPDGEVCYEYECRSRCQEDEDCGKEEACRPCDDPESDENHCFGERVGACVREQGP